MTQATREQLAPFSGLGVPIVVVLANPLNADVHLDPYSVVHALLGNPKVSVEVGPGGPTAAPVIERAEDYGALTSIQPDRTTVNHHPFVSAVVVGEQWPPRGVVSEGVYRRVDVYDVSGNPTPPGFNGTPLPRRLFNGPRDRWWGFTKRGFGDITAAEGWPSRGWRSAAP